MTCGFSSCCDDRVRRRCVAHRVPASAQTPAIRRDAGLSQQSRPAGPDRSRSASRCATRDKAGDVQRQRQGHAGRHDTAVQYAGCFLRRQVCCACAEKGGAGSPLAQKAGPGSQQIKRARSQGRCRGHAEGSDQPDRRQRPVRYESNSVTLLGNVVVTQGQTCCAATAWWSISPPVCRGSNPARPRPGPGPVQSIGHARAAASRTAAAERRQGHQGFIPAPGEAHPRHPHPHQLTLRPRSLAIIRGAGTHCRLEKGEQSCNSSMPCG